MKNSEEARKRGSADNAPSYPPLYQRGGGGSYDPIRSYEKELIDMFGELREVMRERSQCYWTGPDNTIEDWLDFSRRLEAINNFLYTKVINKMGTTKVVKRRDGNGNNNGH